MPVKRSTHYTDENFKYVKELKERVGYKYFNTALNAIIDQHRAYAPYRAMKIAALIRDNIVPLKIKKEELYKE